MSELVRDKYQYLRNVKLISKFCENVRLDTDDVNPSKFVFFGITVGTVWAS